jgi:hypothetical protein
MGQKGRQLNKSVSIATNTARSGPKTARTAADAVANKLDADVLLLNGPMRRPLDALTINLVPASKAERILWFC